MTMEQAAQASYYDLVAMRARVAPGALAIVQGYLRLDCAALLARAGTRRAYCDPFRKPLLIYGRSACLCQARPNCCLPQLAPRKGGAAPLY
jgi:hypothetical protein